MYVFSSFETAVAPFAGAWIEIQVVYPQNTDPTVAPFAGAWIEIAMAVIAWVIGVRRSLRGSVD